MICIFKNTDTKKVVTIHLKAFPNFFLSILGPKFLSIFYSRICTHADGIAFVYQDNANVPIGFVVGSSNPRGFYSRLLKRDWYRFAVASIIPVLRNPSIIRRLTRAFLYPTSNPIGNHVAGLFSLGVDPTLKRTGIGKILVKTFLNEAKKRGCSKVFLTTDSDNNDDVNRFYENLGFVVENQYLTAEGRKMNEFWITI